VKVGTFFASGVMLGNITYKAQIGKEVRLHMATKMGLSWGKKGIAALLLIVVALGAIACDASNATPTPLVRWGAFVTASSLGANNAPSGETKQFSPGQTVYAVAETINFPQGHKVFSRWTVPDGTIEDTEEIVSDRDYTNTFLEFHIGGTNNRQLPTGSYTVQLYVDGNPGPRTEFTVR
jgi:hypothetical protein